MSQSSGPPTLRYRYVDPPSIYSVQTALGEPANAFIVGASGTARNSMDLTPAGTSNPTAIARHMGTSPEDRMMYGILVDFNLHPVEVGQHVNATLHGLDTDTFNQLLHNRPSGAAKFAKSFSESIERHANLGIRPTTTNQSGRSFQVILETNSSAVPHADARCEPCWPIVNPSGICDVGFAWKNKQDHSQGVKTVLYTAPTASRIQGLMVSEEEKNRVNTGSQRWFEDVVANFEKTQELVGTELQRLEEEEPSVTDLEVAKAIAATLKAHLMVLTMYGTLPRDIEPRNLHPEDRPTITSFDWRYKGLKNSPRLKAWKRPGA
jgi:hypothetical protein